MKSSGTMALALVAVAGCSHGALPAGTQIGTRDQAALSSDDDERDTVLARNCTTTEAAPPEGRIASFAAAGNGADFARKIVTYPPASSAAPTVSTKNGALHISANVPIRAEAQYVGTFLGFPACTDAGAYAGVRFSIRGSYSGCSLEYATTDVQHQDRNTPAAYATGKRGAYPPQTRFERSRVTEIAQTVTMPFDKPTIAGNPPLPLDKSKLTGLVWQLSVPLADNVVDGSTACVAALEIDDVAFYR